MSTSLQGIVQVVTLANVKGSTDLSGPCSSVQVKILSPPKHRRDRRPCSNGNQLRTCTLSSRDPTEACLDPSTCPSCTVNPNPFERQHSSVFSLLHAEILRLIHTFVEPKLLSTSRQEHAPWPPSLPSHTFRTPCVLASCTVCVF